MHDLRIQLAASHGVIDVAVGSLPDSQIYDVVKMELALDWSSSAFLPKFPNEQVLVLQHVGSSTIRPTHRLSNQL